MCPSVLKCNHTPVLAKTILAVDSTITECVHLRDYSIALGVEASQP